GGVGAQEGVGVAGAERQHLAADPLDVGEVAGPEVPDGDVELAHTSPGVAQLSMSLTSAKLSITADTGSLPRADSRKAWSSPTRTSAAQASRSAMWVRQSASQVRTPSPCSPSGRGSASSDDTRSSRSPTSASTRSARSWGEDTSVGRPRASIPATAPAQSGSAAAAKAGSSSRSGGFERSPPTVQPRI